MVGRQRRRRGVCCHEEKGEIALGSGRRIVAATPIPAHSLSITHPFTDPVVDTTIAAKSTCVCCFGVALSIAVVSEGWNVMMTVSASEMFRVVFVAHTACSCMHVIELGGALYEM
jgi:hypothetical protein